ncbi:uncharacterized protein LOC131070451 isoform X2 [Cryptomeria japonica]|uniref:uncharacterized protein LOC131070451 isoform X2 n=1 Tax=Cryptomeria japonica TaxID=3369 RepID=UPI0027DA6E76|nr:uncharacterized protein LOC131070451 isoform X2 [Cryptomeria japonica]
MGQRRNKKTSAGVEKSLTSILNSCSATSNNQRSIEQGSPPSRKCTSVEKNGNGDGTAPANDCVISKRVRSRGKHPGKENAVEIELDVKNLSKRRSRRIQSKGLQDTLGNEQHENEKRSAAHIVVEVDSTTTKHKKVATRSSDGEGGQVRKSKRSRVQSSTAAGSSTVKNHDMADSCLKKNLSKVCDLTGTSCPPQGSLLPRTEAEAVETGSNSVPNTPAINLTQEAHHNSADDGSLNTLGMKVKSLQKCQNNDDNFDENDGVAIAITEMHKNYSKLHAKYRKLKARKLDEVDAYIGQQAKKFSEYIDVAEGLLEHLRNDNSRLRSEADESVALNRVKILEHQNAECQSHLLEERSKNLSLVKEVKRLEQLLLDRENMNKQAQNTNQQCQDISTQSFSFSEKSVVLQPERHDGIVDLPCAGLQKLSKNPTSFKEAMVQTEVIVNNCCSKCHVIIEEPGSRQICNKSASGTVSIFNPDSYALSQGDKPVLEDTRKGFSNNVCCTRANGLFQMLLQCMLGLQFSTVNERDGLEVLVLHESSGFSFKLKYLSAEDDIKLRENGQILYCSVSLGTLQKIAPDWMKEEIVFSMGQANLFFDRILQVVNGCGINILAR